MNQIENLFVVDATSNHIPLVRKTPVDISALLAMSLGELYFNLTPKQIKSCILYALEVIDFFIMYIYV